MCVKADTCILESKGSSIHTCMCGQQHTHMRVKAATYILACVEGRSIHTFCVKAAVYIHA